MKLSTTLISRLTYIVAILHIVLFTYAAVSKISDFQNFQVQLGQSPLLTAFADKIALIVPSIEILIAIVLMIPKYRIIAIYASVFLMFLFTVYIVMILNFTSFVPCSCGGVLEKLSWKEHLLFNIVFVVIGIIVILLNKGIKHTAIITIVGIGIGTIMMTLLFLISEEIMHNENPFIRRFPQGTAARVASIDLKNTSYYIAGATNEKIYLANPIAPLQVFEYDPLLNHKKIHTIQLEQENFPFKAIQIKIVYPHFFLYDKTVPVIYRGSVTDWKAKLINNKKVGFNEIVFSDSQHAVIRTQMPNTTENILGIISFKDTIQLENNKTILQKQTDGDGVFDTDGTMQFSYEANKLIYTYYYRNQYITTDENLKNVKRGNTIDTTTTAKIKVIKINKSGDTKLAAPPYMVNKLTTVTNNLLMVNSMLRGKFESEKVWKNAAAVDVYDIITQEYLLSFYVYDEEEFKMKDFLATQEAVYIISGHFLLKYGFGERLKSKFKN